MRGAGSEASPSATATQTARRAYPKHKGFQRAVIRGWYARLAKKSRDTNPYKGRAIGPQGGTFTFAWRAAWETGWRGADQMLRGAR